MNVNTAAALATIGAPIFVLALAWAFQPVKRRRVAPTPADRSGWAHTHACRAGQLPAQAPTPSPLLDEIIDLVLARDISIHRQVAGGLRDAVAAKTPVATVRGNPSQLTPASEPAPYSRKPGASTAIEKLRKAGLGARTADAGWAGTVGILNEQEALVLWYRDVAGDPTRIVAKSIGVSPSTVHAIERRAVDKLIAAHPAKEKAVA